MALLARTRPLSMIRRMRCPGRMFSSNSSNVLIPSSPSSSPPIALPALEEPKVVFPPAEKGETLPWLRDSAADTAFKSVSKPPQPPLFDTYAVVMELKLNGFSERQAVSVKEALDQAIRTSLTTKLTTLATQSQLANAESALKESLFNFSLKYDMQQRHSKELLKADIEGLKVDTTANSKTVQADFQAFRSENSAFRSEIRHLLRTDLSLLEQQLLRLAKDVDAKDADTKAQLGQLENKLIKYGMAVLFSVFGSVVAVARLFL